MPKAIPMRTREEIVRRKREEREPLTIIAEELGVPYDTVLGIWRRYRRRGEDGLRPSYDCCCRRGIRLRRDIHEAALQMRCEHPGWGGGVIRVQLGMDYDAADLPHERTLQRWFRAAGLQLPRSRPVPQNRERAREVHEVWQMDAKEQMQTLDGEWHCTLDVVDEASGALLEAVLFPPALLE